VGFVWAVIAIWQKTMMQVAVSVFLGNSDLNPEGRPGPYTFLVVRIRGIGVFKPRAWSSLAAPATFPNNTP
jgi:hypothetical protein